MSELTNIIKKMLIVFIVGLIAIAVIFNLSSITEKSNQNKIYLQNNYFIECNNESYSLPKHNTTRIQLDLLQLEGCTVVEWER